MKKFFKGFGKKTQKGTSPGPSPSFGRRAGATAALIGYDVKEKELGKLHKAAWTGDVTKVKQLAKKDPSPTDKENRTPLHLAAACGHSEVVRELLEWKAKTNVGDLLGKTPLMKAVESQREDCVRQLLYDSDVDLKDIRGETALHHAAHVGNITITELLLSKRANVNLRNKAGCSPLHVAVQGKRDEIAHRLIQDGSDVDSIDSNERTPLMLACQDGNLTMVKVLLQNHADTEIRDVKGWTADDIAGMQGHHSCSQLITDHNCRFKRPPSVVSTPRSGASFLPGSAQNTPRQDSTSTGFGAPAGNMEDNDSGEETVSKASAAGGGYDSWNSDTDLSLTDDKKKDNDVNGEEIESGPKLNLSKMVKNMSESDDPVTPRSEPIPEEVEDQKSKGKVQPQDSLSDHWSEPESPLAPKRSATRVSFKRDEELSQVHNISTQDEESSGHETTQQRVLNNGQTEIVEGYSSSVLNNPPKIDNQEMSQEKMRGKQNKNALMEELGISEADDLTDVEFSEEASLSLGDNSKGNKEDTDGGARQGILKNWKQLGYTDETELDDFIIPVKLKKAKSLEEIDAEQEENSEWDSDVEGLSSPRPPQTPVNKHEESDWDSTVDAVTPRNPQQYQQLEEEEVKDDINIEVQKEGVSSGYSDLNLEMVHSTPLKEKPSPMEPQDEEESAWDSEDELSNRDLLPDNVTKPSTNGQQPVIGVGGADDSDEEETESISEWELERQKLKQKQKEEEEARQLEEERKQKAERERIEAERQKLIEDEQRRLETQRKQELETERERQYQEEMERQNQEAQRLQELQAEENQKRILEAEREREEAEQARIEEAERHRQWELEEQAKAQALAAEAQLEMQIEESIQPIDHFESGDQLISKDVTGQYQSTPPASPNGEELDRIHREQVSANLSSNHPVPDSIPANDNLVRMSLQSDGNSYDEDDSMMSDNFMDSPRDNRPANLYNNLGVAQDDDGLSYTSTEDFGGELQTVPYGRDILSGMTFGDSSAAIKLQENIRDQKRLIEREKSQRTLLENKQRLLLKENDDLQRKVEDLSQQRSSLEQVKLDLESKTRSLAYNLNEETEKKKNADVLLLKTKEQLDRKEEQYTSEMESKQKIELAMRNVQMELRAAQSTIKQLNDEKQDLERHLAQEKSARALLEQLQEEQQRRLRQHDTGKDGSQSQEPEQDVDQSEDTVEKLRAEVYTLKMELDRQRARFKDDQSVLTNENEELQGKIEDLKNDLKLNEEALTHATMQYNVQLSSMRTENSMLTSSLDKERAAKDKLEVELESMRNRQHTAALELERSQQARNEAERVHQREKEDLSKQLERREHELNTTKDNLQTMHQRATTAESKLTSVENELHMNSSSLLEKNSLSSQLQRDLDQLKSQSNTVEENYRKEKEQVNTLQVKLESAQDRVNSLQHENLTLKQQLETLQHSLNERTGMDINEKFTAMLSSLKSDHDKSRSSLEEKTSSMSEMSNRLREELRNSDNKRMNLEQELRRLNQDYNDAMKRCTSAETSLEILQRAKNQLEQERNQYRLESEKSTQKYQIAHEKTMELQGRITELVDRLERAEHTSVVSSQQLAQSSANVQAFNKSKDEDYHAEEMEDNVHKLQLELAKTELELKHEKQRGDLLQRDLDDSQKVRSSLEALCSNLKSTNAHLEDKLGEETANKTVLHQEAEDSKDLWEKEVLSRSKLGLRIAQLDRQKQEVTAQLDEEKRKVRKAIEAKRIAETKLEAEVDKNAQLQKEIGHLRAYLKSAKKKLKLNNIDDLSELQNQLQEELDHKDLLQSKNRTLESLISPSKAYKMDKNQRSLNGGESYLFHRQLPVENGFSDDFEVAQAKRELEAKYRMELNRKLEDVNRYLEEQAQARDRLDYVRNNNETSLKVEKRKLEDEVSELKLKYEQAMAEKQSKDLEARRFRDLYDGEMKWRMKLGDQLQRSTEKSYDYKSRLSTEMQRSRIYGSVGNLNSSVLKDNSYMDKSRISNRLDTDDPLNRQLKAELDRSIAKHLEAGPHENLKPIIRKVDEKPLLDSSLAKSNADYLAILKKKYFV